MLKALPTSSGRELPDDDERVLVALEADPVAGAMDEVVAEACVGDDLAPGRVDLLGGRRPLPHRSRSAAPTGEHRTGAGIRLSAPGSSSPVTQKVRVISDP